MPENEPRSFNIYLWKSIKKEVLLKVAQTERGKNGGFIIPGISSMKVDKIREIFAANEVFDAYLEDAIRYNSYDKSKRDLRDLFDRNSVIKQSSIPSDGTRNSVIKQLSIPSDGTQSNGDDSLEGMLPSPVKNNNSIYLPRPTSLAGKSLFDLGHTIVRSYSPAAEYRPSGGDAPFGDECMSDQSTEKPSSPHTSEDIQTAESVVPPPFGGNEEAHSESESQMSAKPFSLSTYNPLGNDDPGAPHVRATYLSQLFHEDIVETPAAYNRSSIRVSGFRDTILGPSLSDKSVQEEGADDVDDVTQGQSFLKGIYFLLMFMMICASLNYLNNNEVQYFETKDSSLYLELDT
eukprot:GHVH01001329.1.p1 GENE.GHVH01001329.1~~GHVH01001329.1.p1  ORF type:complete len:348 (-),score=41.52 GHVH01001329.1:166-1209(-)